MARLLLAAALAASALLAVRAAEIAEDEGVLVLTEQNFDEAVEKYSPLLVEFYAPWCGHCKKLAPEYAAAAKTLAEDGLKIAKVDATVERALGDRFGIQGFPTLKFFRGSASNPGEYNGGRQAADIVNWVRRKSGPAMKTVSSAEEAAELVKKSNVVVFGFFAEASSEAAKAFATLAGSIDDVTFASSSDAAVRKAYGAPEQGDAVIIANAFGGEEAPTVAYKGKLTDSEALNRFVSVFSLPRVVAFSPEVAPKIFRGAVRTHFLLFADPAAEATAALMGEYRAVADASAAASEDAPAYLFVTVDPSQDRVASYFGITKADFPTAVIVTMPDGAAMKKFLWDKEARGALTTAAMKAFLADFDAGKLRPHLKSEAAPDAASEAAAPVKTVVGVTFDAVALAPGKDVLLEFYAPWCGHCKKLAPEYEALGKSLSASSSVVIAKMDATANEIDYPGVNVRGFPTILLFKDVPSADGAKTVVEYDGERTVEGFKAFLAQNAAHGLGLTGEDAEDAKEEL